MYAKHYHSELSNRKIQGDNATDPIPLAAYWLYRQSILWCSQNETDGQLTVRRLRGLAHDDDDDVESTIRELVSRSLLDPDGRGYRVHDYLEHQTSADHIAKKRASTRERVKRHRERLAESPCNAVTTGDVTALQTPFVRHKTETETETEISHPDARDVTALQTPSRAPSPSGDESEGNSVQGELALLEQRLFPRFGAVGPTAVAALRNLLPVSDWEVEALERTSGKSWSYGIKVLRSMREEAAKPAPAARPRAAVDDAARTMRRIAQSPHVETDDQLIWDCIRKLGGRRTLATMNGRDIERAERDFRELYVQSQQ